MQYKTEIHEYTALCTQDTGILLSCTSVVKPNILRHAAKSVALFYWLFAGVVGLTFDWHTSEKQKFLLL